MIAHSEWKEGRIFEGIAENGNTITFDADAAHKQGPSPMEAVLMALCGCTSVDVVGILTKKRQDLTGLRVTASAKQAGKLFVARVSNPCLQRENTGWKPVPRINSHAPRRTLREPLVFIRRGCGATA